MFTEDQFGMLRASVLSHICILRKMKDRYQGHAESFSTKHHLLTLDEQIDEHEALFEYLNKIRSDEHIKTCNYTLAVASIWARLLDKE